MRIILTLIMSCVVYAGWAKQKTTYEKLCEVNACWQEQQDINTLTFPDYEHKTEHSWISTHLQLVEQVLRARSTKHLTAQQKSNRLFALQQLNSYWQAGNFPVNNKYTIRTPIFIDEQDNFCAVGYLVKATGYEAISRTIAAKTNLAYVREMHYPQLEQWANDYGFTKDELAWIQPGYPPTTAVMPVGKGTDGNVYELYVSGSGDKLYVGGIFNNVDSSISANNIAYITENSNEYTWHSLGTGVNGKVCAITEFDGKLFVAGAFSMAGTRAVNNVAYWDGAKWNSAGCIYGTVNDLIVYNDKLYAAGNFDVCAALPEVNFAEWNGTMWVQHTGIEGHINTMHIQDNDLLLGGQFTYSTDTVNIIKWNSSTGFAKFNQKVDNEVLDIAEHNQTLHVSTRKTHNNTLIIKLDKTTGNWVDLNQLPFTTRTDDSIAVHTMCTDNNRLLAGGNLYHLPMLGTSTANCVEVNDTSVFQGDAFGVDSTVRVMVSFKNKVFIGGDFKTGSRDWRQVAVNSIAQQNERVSVNTLHTTPKTVHIYPNPTNGQTIIIENGFAADAIKVFDMQGKLILSKRLKTTTTQELNIGNLPVGNYTAELTNATGDKAVQKITIVQ